MKVPCFYIYLQYKFLDNSNKNYIEVSDINLILSKYRVPKALKKYILDEMEDLKLIKKLGKLTYFVEMETTKVEFKSKYWNRQKIIANLFEF